MEEKKREFLKSATEVYLKYGIKSVTMDEMARQLGVSKKTIYQFASDKNDLVEQCLMLSHLEEDEAIQDIMKAHENAIDQLLGISKFIIAQLRKVHPSIFFDLAKYHPSAMKLMDNHKNTYVCGCIEQNLKTGIAQGFYRKNLSPSVISMMYVGMIDMLMNSEITESFDLRLDEVYSEMIRYHIRGCASEKGINYLQEFTRKENAPDLGI